jgi:hypothetical protein
VAVVAVAHISAARVALLALLVALPGQTLERQIMPQRTLAVGAVVRSGNRAHRVTQEVSVVQVSSS